ncbi:MAG TPA: hypothetical protein VMU84_04765 [Thermoanaerobaculia bacterium]|nr:hypothetical protein [Thermoanaerobaculia bacterium]
MSTVVVPVVGSITGANNVRWKTDIELVNDLKSETTVTLMLPTAAEQPFILTTIGPGDTLRFTDVVSEAFGMDAALSPLVVSTLGRRSVTIRATVYGVRGTEVFKPQPIAINYGSGYYPQRTLPGLSFNDAYRTNIGLVNLSDKPVEFGLGLQRIPGRTIAYTRIPIAPNTLWHVAIQYVFPLITAGDDFSIVIETSSPDTYVYASVIENETNSAKFIQPSIGAAASLAAQ